MARNDDTTVPEVRMGSLSANAEAAIRAAREYRPGPFSTEEEARRAQIDLPADPDDPEDFDVTVGDMEDALELRRARLRGPQKAPTKRQVTLRLDEDVVDHFRAGGSGWQTRLNAALRTAAHLDV